MLNFKKGFTLLEVLLVIAIIAILAAIIIVAINPAKQLQDARNAQRETDVETILSGVYQYIIDNDGAYPNSLTSTSAVDICLTGVTGTACTGQELSDLTANGTYIVAIPEDPQNSSAVVSGYQINLEGSGVGVTQRVTVSAPSAEGKTISVTR